MDGAVFQVVPASTLNRVGTSAEERQLTIAGAGAAIPVVYGQPRIGGRLLNVLEYQGTIVMQVLWGYACDAIEELRVNDAMLVNPAAATHYTGAQSSVDATMAAAFAAAGVTYTDTLAGYAYSVVRLYPAEFSGALNVTARVRGRKLYDPRKDSTNGGSGAHRLADTATWEWSDNPTLALADWRTNTVYGARKTVDWATVITCAAANDAQIGSGTTETHRTLSIAFTEPQLVGDVEEVLRAYAGVFILPGSPARLLPDAAASSVASYSHASGEILALGALKKKDLGNAPTVVEILYTDTSVVPHRDESAYAPPKEEWSALPALRLSQVRMPGVTRYSQARREAIERLNKLRLADLAFELTVADIGLRHELGDVITVTHPVGLGAKPMRIVDAPQAPAPGSWTLPLSEYDPAVYSTLIETQPSYADTSLPNPSAPPAVTSVTATEELFQQVDGSWNSRLRITIAAPTFIFFGSYRVEIYDNLGALVDAATTLQPSYASPPLVEGITYTIRAQIISVTGAAGAWAQTATTFTGKLAPPSDVTGLTGYEAGGELFLSWSPAFDIDLRGYEIRFGSTSATWDTATLLDRVFALKLRSKGVLAAGVYRFFVKAFDSVGGLSANAATVDVTVTLDPDSLATEYRPSNPSLSGMITVSERDGATYDITQVGAATFDSQFTAAVGTYTNPISSYWAGASSWEGDNADPWGVQLTGDWNCESQHSAISGSVTMALRLSTDNSSFTDYTTLPTKQTARYARVKLSTTGCMKVKRGTQRAWVNAVVRKEYGNDTSSASAGKTISLTGKYFTWRRFNIEPYFAGSAAARSHNIDNIVLSTTGANSFDVNIYDAGGTRVAQNFNWTFEGV